MRIRASGCPAGGILTSQRTSSCAVKRGTPDDRYPANHPTKRHRGAQSRRRHRRRRSTERLGRDRRRRGARTADVPARMGGDGRQGPQAVADEVPGLGARQCRAHHRCDPVGNRQAAGRGLHRTAHDSRSAELLGPQCRGFPRGPTSEASQSADEGQAADHRLPALPGRRVDHSVELPVYERPDRRGPRTCCRRRGLTQTLRGDAVVRGRICPRVERNRRAARAWR